MTPLSNDSSTPSTRDHSPGFVAPRAVVPTRNAALDTMECLIQSIVTCMLRRELRNDLGSLRQYLKAHFPQLPADLRDVVILTTFKTAQKVVATHFDTLVDGSDDRSVWAVRSLTHWLHGLSISEQMAGYNESPEHGEPKDPDGYSPLNNCFYTKDLPVPINSATQMAEAQRDFDRATEEILMAQEQTNANGSGHSPEKTMVASTLKSVALNLVEATVPQTIVEQGSDVPVSSTHTRKVVYGMPIICDNIPEMQETPVKIPEDGELVDSPTENFIVTLLHDLLGVEMDDPVLNDEMSRPLDEMVTPLITPMKDMAASATQVPETTGATQQKKGLDNIAADPMEDGDRESKEKKKSKTPKKPRMDKDKENTRQRSDGIEDVADVPRRKEVVKKRRDGEKLTPIRWREREGCERPRSFQYKSREREVINKTRETDIGDFRQPVPDFNVHSSLIRIWAITMLTSDPRHHILTCTMVAVTGSDVAIASTTLYDVGGPEPFHFPDHPGFPVSPKTSRHG